MAKHFINRGDGWMCRRCLEEAEERAPVNGGRARFFTEGEAEQREPVLSAPFRARWRDSSRRVLFCSECNAEEMMNAE
ncbi:MAG: hypothetical protein M3430_07855 [Acidobacteriota bacterium]|nr:hypothetical protein [Acidobacteriota bacterium]